MATQTVSPDTTVAVLDVARSLTESAGAFTIADLVERTNRSESTARAAVAHLMAEGAVVRAAEGRGRYVVVVSRVDAQPARAIIDELSDGTIVTTTIEDDHTVSIDAAAQDEKIYRVYAFGAGGQVLNLKRAEVWVLTDDAQLANFKTATELPVSGWTADGKRRAVTELRVYVAGSPLDSKPVHVAKPQELKKARTTA